MNFSNYKCWKTDRIGKVITKAALDIDNTTFFATHMPMRNISYEKSPQEIKNTSEEDFLSELIRMDQSDLHVFAIIKGIPGTGKSHLIRWLYEKYKQSHPGEIVILIERANASLKKTIEQIINNNIFEDEDFQPQLTQLIGATEAISENGLEDTLINHLQVGSIEMENKWKDVLQHRLEAEKIKNFLLDINVRDHLKNPNGPIKRIVRYMQVGKGIDNDEIPEFHPEDLIFEPIQLQRIKQGGYQDAQEIAEVISRSNDKHRIQLARYLNFILRNYAISKASNITAADLRDIFNELRRKLRIKGENLALFIEDITAFTGIDSGLIDVLVTEHRGVGNVEFCKLTSVVGITDGYYKDNIPDNVQERITHELTLNSSLNNSSQMLENKDSLFEFTGRYLNAIRFESKDFDSWMKDGADLSNIPNACNNCQYRIVCHEAFEKINISSNKNNPNYVGLYPFNKKSIENLYSSLAESVSKTPRSLLNDILSYILQSHGDEIEVGKFPPPVTRLAPKIKIREFDPQAHRRVIEEQGQSQSDSLITLFLYWGNQNAFSDKKMEKTIIGGISIEALKAFSLPIISGQSRTAPVNSLDTTIQTQEPVRSQPDSETHNDITHLKYITDWVNGAKLYGHNDFLKWIVQFFYHSIDWMYYDLPPSRVLTPNQASSLFAIQDQIGQIISTRFVFQKDNYLRDALIALVYMNNKEVSLKPEQYSEFITSLYIWLNLVEGDVVAYLRDISKTLNVDVNTLPTMLIENSVLLACLMGNLRPEMSTYEIYKEVLLTCSGNEKELLTKWENKIKEIQYYPKWQNLMSSIKMDVGVVFEETLNQFGSYLGDSKTVQFLKAKDILSIIKIFNENNWKLSAFSNLPPSGIGQRVWDSTIRINKILKEQFFNTIQKTFNDYRTPLEEIQSILNDSNADEVFVKIRKLISDLQTVEPVSNDLSNDLRELNSHELQLLLLDYKELDTNLSKIDIAKHLSKRMKHSDNKIGRYKDFLNRFINNINQISANLNQKIGQNKKNKELPLVIEETKRMFLRIETSLNNVLHEDI